MLKDAALNGFVLLVDRVESKTSPKANVHPDTALCAVGPTDKLLFAKEYARLCLTLRTVNRHKESYEQIAGNHH